MSGKECGERRSRQNVTSGCLRQEKRERGRSEKTNIARNAKAEEKVHQRLSCMEAARGVHLSALRSLRKPPGTETPVNPGNKKMIKSDLMSRRRQAKTHICHSETDVTAPPTHFSRPPSLTHTPAVAHSFITLSHL